MTVETCDECRFDGAHYNKTDARRSLQSMATRWRWTVDSVDASCVDTRPDGLPSLLELVRGALDELAASADGATTLPVAIDQLERRTVGLDEELSEGTTENAARRLRALHACSHRLMQTGRVVHALGAGAAHAHGTVHGVFASGGGVPKTAIEEAVVGYRGVDGDTQAARQHHGRVWQALCLWSADVVDRLRAEGHPIRPGNAGENVSIAGIDWCTLRPGARLSIGDVLAEVSAYSIPCTKNAGWFLDGDFQRMHHDREPGVSRLYASVLRDGTIRAGDAVVVEPEMAA